MNDKRYGHFDDQHREYVITDPKTPWPWINYLGNEDFFSLISNTAGGPAIATTTYRWIMVDATSTLTTTETSGILDGSLARRHWISTSADTA